jgi:hypothetical protein
MSITGISEKEIELAQDLKGKLDNIEGRKPRKPKSKVSQDVTSPADADRTAAVGDMDQMKQKLESLEKPDAVIKVPDPVKHKYISFAKSGVRIIAGGCLITGNLLMAGICFIMAEVLGIVEEMV